MTIDNLKNPHAIQLLPIAIWVGFFLLTLHFRPLIPIDETRYLAVAWEMWQRQNFIVPHLNGQTYSHKPPLLFWIIQGGWWLFGVHDWVARMVPGLFAMASLLLLVRLSRTLWPDDDHSARFAPLVLLTTLYWLLFTTTLMFDLMVGFFALLGVCGICQVWRSGNRWGWWIVGLAIGGGVLAKGPVILVYILPIAFLAPLWMDRQDSRRSSWLRWYSGCAFAIVLGASIALAWALPAAYLGGEAYANQILWGQTSGRLVAAFSHQRPWWWYLAILPLMLYPWFFWLPAWRGLQRCQWDSGARLCATWAGSGLLIFMLISGKQAHYLLPLFPAIALLTVRVTKDPVRTAYDGWVVGSVMLLFAAVQIAIWVAPEPFLVTLEWPAWVADIAPYWGLLLLIVVTIGIKLPTYSAAASTVVLAISNVTFVLIHVFGVMHPGWSYYDTNPMATRLAVLQDQQVPIAIVAKYHGEFQFTGRLTQPIDSLKKDKVKHWLTNNPTGQLIVYTESPIALERQIVEYDNAYRGRHISLLDGAKLASNPALLDELGY